MTKIRSAKVIRIFVIVMLALVGISILVNSYALMSQLPIAVTTQDVPGGSAMPLVFSWIKANVPQNSRIAYEEFPSPSQHSFAAGPAETGISEVGSGYAFWWSGADANQEVEQALYAPFYFNAPMLYQEFEQMNVGYVVVFGNDISTLAGASSDFQLVQKIGNFDIFELKNFTPTYAYFVGGSGNLSVSSFQPEKIVLHLTNVTEGSSIVVRVSYYSNWFALLDNGTSYPIKAYSDPAVQASFMKVENLNGGSYNLTLVYGQTNIDTEANDISTLSVILIAIAFAYVSVQSRLRLSVADYLVGVVRRASNFVKSARSTS
jgi:hypothetical protein